MSAGTLGLTVVDTDRDPHTISRWSRACYVSAATYPMNLPYRDEDNKGSAMTGRLPRIINIVLTTMVAGGHPDWNRKTRTLTFTTSWRVLYLRAGLSGGGAGTERIRNMLSEFSQSRMTMPDGTEFNPVEELVLPDRGTLGGHVTFSREYVRMLTAHPRELPLNAVGAAKRSSLMLDILVLAALYCPDDKPLLIARSDLPDILPATSQQSLSQQSLNRRLTQLNASQDVWRFRLDKKRIMVSPADVWATVRDGVEYDVPSVTLVRQAE